MPFKTKAIKLTRQLSVIGIDGINIVLFNSIVLIPSIGYVVGPFVVPINMLHFIIQIIVCIQLLFHCQYPYHLNWDIFLYLCIFFDLSIPIYGTRKFVVWLIFISVFLHVSTLLNSPLYLYTFKVYLLNSLINTIYCICLLLIMSTLYPSSCSIFLDNAIALYSKNVAIFFILVVSTPFWMSIISRRFICSSISTNSMLFIVSLVHINFGFFLRYSREDIQHPIISDKCPNEIVK